MTRFVSGADRHQIALLPHRLDDYVAVIGRFGVPNLAMPRATQWRAPER